MKLLLIRHGETNANLNNIMQGHWHGSLSENGKKQIEKLGKFLKNEKIDFIYSSDLMRATITAQEIAKYHEPIKVIYLKNLREMYLGKLQGEKKLDLKLYSQEEQLEIFNKAGAETLTEMYIRAKNVLKNIFQNHQNKQNQTIVLVGHNGINKAIIAVLTDKKAESIPNIEAQKNTAINVIEINGEYCKIIKFNNTEHLN